MSKVTPFLMFNDQLEAALSFYSTTFPDSEIRNVARTGKDGPITSAEFVIGGQSFMGYNGGPYFKFSEGISLFVDCEDQEEVDEYWNKLVRAGATPSQCGWITDQFGITWQIVPRRFMELATPAGDRVVSRWVCTGMNNGMFDSIPDGRQVSFTGIAIWAVRDGKLSACWLERSEPSESADPPEAA